MQRTSNEKSALLLQAFLDLSDHPAWVTDKEGTVVLNARAKELSQQGVSLSRLSECSNPKALQFHAGRGWNLTQRDLNHGTGCTLFELKRGEEGTHRVRESSQRLDAALALYK